MSATQAILADGRHHFQHGPIDLVIGADGDASAVRDAHARAWSRFVGILDELVAELPLLKAPLSTAPVADACPVRGETGRRMWEACAPHRARFITPMAAVAGAVADTLIGCYEAAGVERAWINNGGDIALHLAPGASVRVGLYADLSRFHGREPLEADGRFVVASDSPVRGVATSGWRGRSFSRGIADSVTVLARTAADADAAATMIANAVDADDIRIVRRPASSLKDDSDLGDLAVTVEVPRLDASTIDAALLAGFMQAEHLRDRGLIVACALVCQGRSMRTGPARVQSRGRAWHGPRLKAGTLEAA